MKCAKLLMCVLSIYLCNSETNFNILKTLETEYIDYFVRNFNNSINGANLSLYCNKSISLIINEKDYNYISSKFYIDSGKSEDDFGSYYDCLFNSNSSSDILINNNVNS